MACLLLSLLGMKTNIKKAIDEIKYCVACGEKLTNIKWPVAPGSTIMVLVPTCKNGH